MISVAVGIIRQDDTVLLCLRPDGKPYARQWEFPGGKLEAGESPEDCLRRELQEELGVRAEIGQLYHRESHLYPDSGRFDVYYYIVPSFSGTLTNHVFGEMRWVPVNELESYDNLEGNRNVIRKLIQRGI
jgi:8-oxo-dGTP diphosphatase